MKKYAKKTNNKSAKDDKAQKMESRPSSTSSASSRSLKSESRSSSTSSAKPNSRPSSTSKQQASEMPTTYTPRVFSQREQEEKLTGYLEISKEIWPQIRYGTHIRYYLKTGEFRTGGFVSKNPFEVIVANDSIQHPTAPERLNKEKKTYIKIQNGFNDKLKGYYQWIVSYDDIEKIYIKPDAGVLTMVKTLELVVNGLNENIHKLALSSRMLEKRIAQLEK
jgi:hypothetical protein